MAMECTPPFSADPIACHEFALHRATAPLKSPPAYTAAPVPSLKTSRQRTSPSNPPPMPDHWKPSHLAIWLSTTPPAAVKAPPTRRLLTPPSVNTVEQYAGAFKAANSGGVTQSTTHWQTSDPDDTNVSTITKRIQMYDL